MADKEQLATLLKEGVDAWNHLAERKRQENVWPDLRAADLRGQALERVNFTGADLRGADLAHANLTGAVLRGADLRKADLRGAILINADLTDDVQSNRVTRLGANPDHVRGSGKPSMEQQQIQQTRGDATTKLPGGVVPPKSWILWEGSAKWNGWRAKHPELRRPDLEGSYLSGADLSGANLQGTVLHGSDLSRANLSGADLRGADLSYADLSGADLSGADVRDSELTGVEFARMKLTRKTNLAGVRFDSDHSAMSDGSDSIVLPKWDERLNWARLRLLFRFPLFGVSWSALFASLIIINSIGFLNEHRWLTEMNINYPIPIPERMMLILIDCVLLVVASTIYKAACPDRVQEFTETQWVESLNRPRLKYISKKLDRRGWQRPTALFGLSGGVLALLLLIDRLWEAFRYMVLQLIPAIFGGG